MKTCNLFCDSIQLPKLECQHLSCKNVNAKKEYLVCKTHPLTDLKYCYSQLFYFKNQNY